jgi:tRNA-specific 2-thiouridylase
LDGRRVKVDFKEPQRSVTPGQSVVFYQDDVVLGGGIIDQPLAAFDEAPGDLPE